MRWVIGSLFDLGEIIDSIGVESELSDLANGELFMRPDVSHIEDVDLLLLPEILGFFGRHCLETNGP